MTQSKQLTEKTSSTLCALISCAFLGRLQHSECVHYTQYEHIQGRSDVAVPASVIQLFSESDRAASSVICHRMEKSRVNL